MPNRLKDAVVKVRGKAQESLGQSQTSNDLN